MLTFAEKLAIADTFPELQRKDVSMGRVNYHYEDSAYEKKTVLYHLHPNGNGFVYAGQLANYPVDDKGFVNIRDYDADELRKLIAASIDSLRPAETAPSVVAGRADAVTGAQTQAGEERWINAKKQTLTLKLEDEDQMWYIYAGVNLDSAFETYEEALEYLQEEGFVRA
ncbi:hypothetical protein [Gorillibacterium massiliense]|uniref:hypothetical protein n=1 Tax=Gorillibacterium massiliense TaxID=1280390 RepID=UPI000592BA6B|nr:hypothetical protein [Gorillibacterium massiliense]